MTKRFGDMEFENIKSSADIRKIIVSLGDYGLSIADANGVINPLNLIHFITEVKKSQLKHNKYLDDNQKEVIKGVVGDILEHIDFFLDKVDEYVRTKYNVSLDDSLRDEAAELAESEENADESSPMELGRVQKMHNINYNKVDVSTTSAALVRAVINSLRRDSSIDPSTGLPVFEVSRKTWYEIPNLLCGVKSIDEMMRVIHEASLKPEYSKYYPTGQRDPVNFLTSLYNRLSSMNRDHKALFLNSVRLYKNKYIKFNEEGFGKEKEIVSEYEPYRQYKAVKDSWAIRFMSKGRVTKASIAELNNAIADIKMLVKDAREFQEIPTLSAIADPLIKALNGIGFTGVTRGAIAYILGADLASKDSEYIADAIEDLIGSGGEFISSARMLGNLMNEKDDKLWNTVRLRKKKYTKSQFINLLPMTHKLARAVTEDLGTAKLNTVIGAEFNRWFVFTKRNELVDIFEDKLTDPNYVEAIQRSAYNKPSTWLRWAKAGREMELYTFLSYTNDDSPLGAEYEKIKKDQNLIYRMSAYAYGYIPLPNFGDRSTAYLLKGIPAVDVELSVNDDGLTTNSAGVFMKYLKSELEAIEQTKREIREAILNAVPEFRGYGDVPLERLIEAYDDLTADEQNMNPPVGLIKEYHYTTVWEKNEDGTKTKFKYVFNGKGLQMRYFGFMGTPEEIRAMPETQKLRLLGRMVEDKINDLIQLAAKEGVIEIIDDSTEDHSDYYLSYGELLFSEHQDGVSPRIRAGSLPENTYMRGFDRDFKDSTIPGDDRAIQIMKLIAKTAVNSMVTSLEFERIAMGDIAFYLNIDDKNARYQRISTTGNNVVTLAGDTMKIFNATRIFASDKDFIAAIRPSYVDYFYELVQEGISTGDTIYSRGLEKYNVPDLDPIDVIKRDNEIQERAEQLADEALSSFLNVEQYDGSMAIMPDTYAKIYEALGMWNTEKEMLLQKILRDKGKHGRNARRLSLQPLKMAYSSLQPEGNLAVPIFWKPAIVPIFPHSVGAAGQAEKLYDFLARNGYDGIIFDHTIKTGWHPSANVGGNNGDFDFSSMEGDVHEQYAQFLDYANLRHQIYTEHQVKKTRSVGVQIDREMISGLKNSDEKFTIKGQEFSANQLYEEWIKIHNDIVENQLDTVIAKFNLYDGTPDEIVLNALENSTQERTLRIEDQMSMREVVDENGNVKHKLNLNINATTNASFILNSISGSIKKDLLRINMPGSEIIQSPAWGGIKSGRETYERTGQLKFRNERGAMEVAVGVDLYKHLIPNFKNMTYEEVRAEVMRNPEKYNGFVYRIPSQGKNFSAKIEVADILPAEFGAIVVVPSGWVISSGSDFYINKDFVILKYYTINENKEIVEVEYDPDSNENGLEAMSNRLADIYETIVSNNSGIVESTFPTDVQTALIKDYILSRGRGRQNKPAIDYTTIDYDIAFHDIVSNCNAGLGASVIANSSHNIFTNFHISLSDNAPHAAFLKKLNLDTLSNNLSNDIIPIAHLLNAMISGHVDAIKNPFIFYSNINRATLNATLYAIRSGFGMATFALMLQPIIKEYASSVSYNEVARKYFVPYVKDFHPEIAVEDVADMPAEEIFSIVSNDFVYEKNQTADPEERGISRELSDGFTSLASFKGFDNELEILESTGNKIDSERAANQLQALILFRALSSAGDMLSFASRLHNLYSNDNTRFFSNLIDMEYSIDSNVENVNKFLDGYEQLYSDEFILGKQIDAVHSFLNALEKSGIVELSGPAKMIYQKITDTIDPDLSSNKRSIIFRSAIRAIRLYFNANFVVNAMKSRVLEPVDLIENIAYDYIALKDSFDSDGVTDGKFLLSSLFPIEMNGKIYLKFNNMLASDVPSQNEMYSSWEELYFNPESKEFAEKLYFYSVLTGKFTGAGTNDLSNFAPASLINGISYTKRDGERVNVDKFFDNVVSSDTTVNMDMLWKFIVGYASNESDIVRTVGRKRGNSVTSLFKGGSLIVNRTFGSSFAANTPLTISTRVNKNNPDDTVRIRFGSRYLTYNLIGIVPAVKANKRGKEANVTYGVYALDTQPVIFSNGEIEVINAKADMYDFKTNNPLNKQQLVEESVSMIEGATDSEVIDH
jgi:hypothetical protein